MINAIVFSVLLTGGDGNMHALESSEKPKIERRRRDKGRRDRRRGGSGLR